MAYDHGACAWSQRSMPGRLCTVSRALGHLPRPLRDEALDLVDAVVVLEEEALALDRQARVAVALVGDEDVLRLRPRRPSSREGRRQVSARATSPREPQRPGPSPRCSRTEMQMQWSKVSSAKRSAVASSTSSSSDGSTMRQETISSSKRSMPTQRPLPSDWRSDGSSLGLETSRHAPQNGSSATLPIS